MELKKSAKADLENKKGVFTQIGLVLSLGIVLMAFSMNDTVKSADSLGELTAQAVEAEVIPITAVEEVKPPPTTSTTKVIEVLTIIDDNAQIDEGIRIRIN
jgi:protein TonB